MIKNVGAWLAVGLAIAGCQEKPKYPGSLQGIVELEERDLAFEVGGRVVRLDLDEGTRVDRDQIVAALDDTLQRTLHAARLHEVEAAEAQVALLEAGPRAEEIRALRARVDAARAAENQLGALLRRHQALEGGPGASPEQVVEEIDARHKAAIAERKAIEQQLRALRKGARSQELDAAIARAAAAASAAELEAQRLTRYELRAPASGTVVSVAVERGEIAAPGVPIATIADPQHPFVDVFVAQNDMAGVHVGAAAEVHVDALDEPLTGAVEYVERRTEFMPRFVFSEAERPNLVIRVRVRVDDPDQSLCAGLPAFVYLR